MANTIATKIVKNLQNGQFAAVTLQAGYAVTYDGKRLLFPPYARTVAEKRDKTGRCIKLICEYADGSRIKFTYSSVTGACYKEN